MDISFVQDFPFCIAPRQFGDWFMDVVRRVDPAFLPDTYDIEEPMRRRIVGDDLRPFLELWNTELPPLWFARNGTSAYVSHGKFVDGSGGHGAIQLGGEVQVACIPRLIQLFQLGAKRWPLRIGAIHPVSDAEFVSELKWDSDHRNQAGALYNRNLRRCIGNLAWGQFLGKGYVDLMGLDRMMSAPAARVEQWGDGVWIQVTENIEEARDFESFNRKRIAIKHHLGRRYFYDPDWEPDRLWSEYYLAPPYESIDKGKPADWLPDPPRGVGGGKNSA